MPNKANTPKEPIGSQILNVTLCVGMGFGLLLLVELAFRLAGVSEPTPYPDTVVQSSQAANYYHVVPGIHTPSEFTALPKIKRPGEKRVVVAGGSSAAGYPDHRDTRGSFLNMLRAGMGASGQCNKMTFINMALPAKQSVDILEDIRHILDYDPDLIIVYAGFNEFYRGRAKARDLACKHPGLWKLWQRIRRHSRIYQLMVDALSFVSSDMEVRIVAQPKQSKDDPGGEKSFAIYLLEAIDLTKSRNCRIVLCNLAKNYVDFWPLMPKVEARRLPPPQRHQYFHAKNLYLSGEIDSALAISKRIAVEGPMDPHIEYLMGRCYRDLRDFEKARDHFQTYASIPQGYLRSLNMVIDRVAATTKTQVFDVFDLAVSNSRHGYIDLEFGIDRCCHPSFRLQHLIAAQLHLILVDSGIVSGCDSRMPFPDFDSMAQMTKLDFSRYNEAAVWNLISGDHIPAAILLDTALHWSPNPVGLILKSFAEFLAGQRTESAATYLRSVQVAPRNASPIAGTLVKYFGMLLDSDRRAKVKEYLQMLRKLQVPDFWDLLARCN